MDNWARYFMAFDGRAKSSGYAQYMSPEERAILGPADRPSNRVDEQAAMRVDAILSVMLRRPELAMFLVAERALFTEAESSGGVS
ncbi:hypothetical protein HQN60_00015 [Deefgea piscis]|uniref:Uncharacterized protein n=1 Tax=Deefgea piscis TaxID=2739061 RepID=A0A6M8SQW4_9NEIS|nr:hypothetical protein [Deefgea piscis]QKJ65249.1 hypothetical protein HQN60_00015 [Deefgea piscis]